VSTERFEKLSKDKRQRILDAAREEFSRVSYEEASINQIIKNAGISRGSFYTYLRIKKISFNIYSRNKKNKTVTF